MSHCFHLAWIFKCFESLTHSMVSSNSRPTVADLPKHRKLLLGALCMALQPLDGVTDTYAQEVMKTNGLYNSMYRWTSTIS